ncbi:hypothetical protein [Chryseobacterium sp. M5A1_1a]
MKRKAFYLFIFVPVTIFSQVGINTPTPTETLDVNGTLKVRNTTKQPNGKLIPIFVDDDGLVTRGNTDPTQLTTPFLYNNNSTTGIIYENTAQSSTYNAGGVNWVTISKNMIFGNIKTGNDNVLSIEEPGVYEVTTSLRYALRAQNATQNRIYTNFYLQVSDEEDPTWRDISFRTTDVYPTTAGSAFSIDLPTTFIELKNKSKFRIIFKRGRYSNSTTFVGNEVAGFRMNEGEGTVSLIFKRI